MDTDVVVLGGGFAGLTCARDLTAAGNRVTLLEARDRLGGRAWYRRLPGTDVEVEYGATWFDRSAQPALAAEIDRYGIAVRAGAPRRSLAWVLDGQRHAGPDVLDRWRRATGELDRALAEAEGPIRSYLGGADPGETARLDVPMTTWLERAGGSREATEFVLAFTAAMGGARPDRLSALVVLLDAIEEGYGMVDVMTEGGETFADGSRSLVEAMAADCGDDIRLETVARRVRRDGEGVSVDLEGGRTIHARAAVLALPLNVWADVGFDPPLAQPKQRAASERHVGRTTKVIALAEGVPPDFLGLGWETPIQALTAWRPEGEGQVLIGFAAREAIDPADHDRVEATVRRFAPEARLVVSDGHDWVGDPWSRGTWLAWPPGWVSSGLHRRLSDPEDRLVVAGSDVAERGAGWMEGAVASGAGAARLVRGILDGDASEPGRV